MTDYELGYQHGFNDDRSFPGVKKYPNNPNYCKGFRDGDWARVNAPRMPQDDDEEYYYY